MKTTVKMIVAAAAAGVAFMASARTIAVTENKTDGVTTSFNLAFSSDSATYSLWMVWGSSDGGTASIADWKESKILGLVPGDMTAWPYSVPVPDGWSVSVSHLRFVLIEGAGIPGAETLEYVEANGSQCVMTGFTPLGTSAVEISFAFTAVADYQALFCARGSAGNKDTFTLFRNKEGSWRWDYGTSQTWLTFNPGTSTHTLRADSGDITIDTTNVGSVATAGFTAAGAMSIFAASNGGSYTPGVNGNFKLYSFKAWRDGSDASTIELDLVPCRKTDGTVCLYNWVDGAFLTVADGSSALIASATVVAPAASVVPAASSGLVAAAMQGWNTTGGTFYPYINPVYVVDVAEGTSKTISEVTFQRMDKNGGSVTTDVSYAEFSSSSDPLTGTIIKRGGGTLTFDEDISIFAGPVHVEEGVAIGVCSNCFGLTVNDNTDRDTQRTYVHSGATLVMDAIGNAPVRTEANAVYYEGDGYPGMGGAFVVRNGDTASGFSRWQLGAKSRTAGAASLYVDVPSGAQVELAPGGSLPGGGIVPQSDFGLAGQKLIVHGRGVESEFVVNHVSIAGIGDLVVSNVTLRMSNAGYLSPASGSDSAIRFRGGARWFWSKDYAGNDQRSTLYVDDMEYASIGEDSSGYNGRGFEPWNAVGAKYNWYNGPVVLNGNFNLFNKGESGGWHNSSGCTFESEVSGCGGFRPYQNMCRNLRLNLLYPTNTFEGGIVLDASSLGVYGERSVPSQEGAGLVSITNGCVYFGRKVASAAVTNNWLNFTMPVTEFVGSGAVTNGTGTWKGLVKKGAGVLDYNSQLGGDYLDLQGGTVKFNTQYREAYTGDNASAAPDGYAAALPVFTTLKGTAGALDLDGVGGSYTVVNVEGYPSVTNGNLTVTGTWTLDVATLGTRAANVSGTLTFGEGAEIVVDGDIDPMNVPGGGFIVARAASITGMPRLVCKGFALEATGGELRIKKSGFVFLVY